MKLKKKDESSSVKLPPSCIKRSNFMKKWKGS